MLKCKLLIIWLLTSFLCHRVLRFSNKRIKKPKIIIKIIKVKKIKILIKITIKIPIQRKINQINQMLIIKTTTYQQIKTKKNNNQMSNNKMNCKLRQQAKLIKFLTWKNKSKLIYGLNQEELSFQGKYKHQQIRLKIMFKKLL